MNPATASFLQISDGRLRSDAADVGFPAERIDRFVLAQIYHLKLPHRFYDLEALALSQNKRFWKLIDNAIARGEKEGFVDLADL